MPQDRSVRPCPECGVEIEPTHAGLYHCDSEDCPVATFKFNYGDDYHSVTYCADVEKEGRKGW